jgi:hypothetical protein
MDEKRRRMPGSAEQQPVPAGETETAAGPDKTMHTEVQTRKPRGRLSREDQRRLGDVLQRAYDDVVQQGIPDRFKALIDQLGHGEATMDTERNRGASGHPDSSAVQARGGDRSEENR